jgi:putative Mn2+ efflux pump MntP
MDNISLILIAVGLAMDAFAVAIVAGITTKQLHIKHAIMIALYFGVFQGIMPLLGWLLGSSFAGYIKNYDHWIAFLLLAFIGGKMIVESRKSCPIKKKDYTCHTTLLFLAVATSIDAFAIGITFSMISVNILNAILLIGGITFLISFIGVYAGKLSGCLLHDYARLAGGLILIAIGIKILLFS